MDAVYGFILFVCIVVFSVFCNLAEWVHEDDIRQCKSFTMENIVYNISIDSVRTDSLHKAKNPLKVTK